MCTSPPISEKINFEGKALMGPCAGFGYDGDDIIISKAYVGYDLGVGLRFNTSEKLSLLLNADYIGVSH